MQITILKNSLIIPHLTVTDNEKTIKVIADKLANDPRFHDDVLAEMNISHREKMSTLNDFWEKFNSRCFCDNRSERELRFACNIVETVAKIAHVSLSYPTSTLPITLTPKEVCDALEWMLEDLAPYIVDEAECLMMCEDESFIRYTSSSGCIYSETYRLTLCHSEKLESSGKD